jgi:hypothetical protein
MTRFSHLVQSLFFFLVFWLSTTLYGQIPADTLKSQPSLPKVVEREAPPDTTQTNSSRLGIGNWAGLGPTGISGNDLLRRYASPMRGRMFGLVFQYRLTEVFALQTGILYKRISAHVTAFKDALTLIESVDVQRNFDFLSVPLLLQASFGKRLKLLLQGGGFVSRLMYETDIYQTIVTPYYISPTPGVVSYTFYKSIEFGVSAGAGLARELKHSRTLGIMLQSNIGLNDINNYTVYTGGPTHTYSVLLVLSFMY